MVRRDSTFSPGFRLSIYDVMILIGGSIAAIAVATVDRWIGLAIIFVVLHFFLFCNIIRMSRPLELAWAVVFSLIALCAGRNLISWPVAFGISMGVTLICLMAETRRPSYHGVGWRKVNPGLPQWWERRNVQINSTRE